MKRGGRYGGHSWQQVSGAATCQARPAHGGGGGRGGGGWRPVASSRHRVSPGPGPASTVPSAASALLAAHGVITVVSWFTMWSIDTSRNEASGRTNQWLNTDKLYCHFYFYETEALGVIRNPQTQLSHLWKRLSSKLCCKTAGCAQGEGLHTPCLPSV